MKNMNADKMIMRSNQSVFSRAVISCLEVSMREFRVSCVCDVARNVAVDSSHVTGQQKGPMGKSPIPSIWVVRTDRSSSLCMRFIVRRRASVTSSFALVSAS